MSDENQNQVGDVNVEGGDVGSPVVDVLVETPAEVFVDDQPVAAVTFNLEPNIRLCRAEFELVQCAPGGYCPTQPAGALTGEQAELLMQIQKGFERKGKTFHSAMQVVGEIIEQIAAGAAVEPYVPDLSVPQL